MAILRYSSSSSLSRRVCFCFPLGGYLGRGVYFLLCFFLLSLSARYAFYALSNYSFSLFIWSNLSRVRLSSHFEVTVLLLKPRKFYILTSGGLLTCCFLGCTYFYWKLNTGKSSSGGSSLTVLPFLPFFLAAFWTSNTGNSSSWVGYCSLTVPFFRRTDASSFQTGSLALPIPSYTSSGGLRRGAGSTSPCNREGQSPSSTTMGLPILSLVFRSIALECPSNPRISSSNL